MKTLLLFILAGCFLVSCSDLIDQNTFAVDKPLQPFYDSFMQKAKSANVKFIRSSENLSIGVGPLNYPRQGETNYDRKSIVINEILIRSNLGHAYNDHADSMEVQYVVYHELAHYFLGREHLPDSAYTIMTARSSYLLNYMRNRRDEVELNVELFQSK